MERLRIAAISLVECLRQNSGRKNGWTEMEENGIYISEEKTEYRMLPMNGRDSQGNFYEADALSLRKNGKRFLPVMGEFHFSRYEPEDWEEELLKIKAGGVTIVATYVLWIHHEEGQGEWDFSGCRNLRKFLELCRKTGLQVWLRIGPWAHGECRNGGFPDWVVNDIRWKVRTNDPAYLKLVETFYRRIGEQAKGMMCRDGGPVIGIQLENEYGHCGGPLDREEGMAHMRTLKRMASDAGLEAPYYTATGWGGAYVVEGETLPVMGGYVDAPWAEHTDQMPASENFIFSKFKQDRNIGSDRKVTQEDGFTFDPSQNPYLTAELGGGLQVTAHRRTWPSPEDIEAQSVCMLGSGANLLGYYMYHGGINPDGKYSTLQESRATGYANDLPVKSYDFQTCIRESGEIGASFGRLKKIHLMLQDFGESLAGARTFFPEARPDSPEDLQTLRVTARVNPETGAGFLFLNNHQRHREMQEHTDSSVRLIFADREETIDHLNLKDGMCGILPFHFPFGDKILEKTNAFLLCRLGERIFFYIREKGEAPYFLWKEEACDTVVLSAREADRAFRFGNCLYLTEHNDDCLIENTDGTLWLLTKHPKTTLIRYRETGEPERITAEANFSAETGTFTKAGLPEQTGHTSQKGTQSTQPAQPLTVTLTKEKPSQKNPEQPEYREYTVRLNETTPRQHHQLYLEADYAGDRAEVYIDGRLADDWFTTGEKWHIALKRLGDPKELTLRIYSTDSPLPNPYGGKVYYDLPTKQGCEIFKARLIPEYKIKIES